MVNAYVLKFHPQLKLSLKNDLIRNNYATIRKRFKKIYDHECFKLYLLTSKFVRVKIAVNGQKL